MASYNNKMIVAMYRAMKFHTKRYPEMRCEAVSIARDGDRWITTIDAGAMSKRRYVVPLTVAEPVTEVGDSP